ncbi:pentatricopeptide repeat (PPR) superfamily protein [Wolffia australiana]
MKPARLLSPLHRHLSSSSSSTPDVAIAIASALRELPSHGDDLPRHLSLRFSHVPFSTSLLSQILSLSPPPLSALLLFRWAVSRRSFTPSDASLSLLASFLGRHRHFPALSALLLDFRPSLGPKSLHSAFLRLIRAGRPLPALNLLKTLPPDPKTLASLVSLLADRGHGALAEKLVKESAPEVFPDDALCCDLIRAWCASGKLDQARRLMEEMRRGGFELGTEAYNSILACVSLLCLKKDPLRLQSEADKVLSAMAARGVPKNADTFHILISNLCKIRRTEAAMEIFRTMEIPPNSETFVAVMRSLYQAGRTAEGDEVMEKMRGAGLGRDLGRKEYYGFVKILCGIERVDHAVRVFRLGKGYGFVPGKKTYELLVEKLWKHGQVCRARSLMKEAAARGVEISAKEYDVDERFVKKKKEKKKKEGKKRLSLPEKMERKRKRLRKLRLSFVKKPKGVRRAY